MQTVEFNNIDDKQYTIEQLDKIYQEIQEISHTIDLFYVEINSTLRKDLDIKNSFIFQTFFFSKITRAFARYLNRKNIYCIDISKLDNTLIRSQRIYKTDIYVEAVRIYCQIIRHIYHSVYNRQLDNVQLIDCYQAYLELERINRIVIEHIYEIEDEEILNNAIERTIIPDIISIGIMINHDNIFKLQSYLISIFEHLVKKEIHQDVIRSIIPLKLMFGIKKIKEEKKKKLEKKKSKTIVEHKR